MRSFYARGRQPLTFFMIREKHSGESQKGSFQIPPRNEAFMQRPCQSSPERGECSRLEGFFLNSLHNKELTARYR